MDGVRRVYFAGERAGDPAGGGDVGVGLLVMLSRCVLYLSNLR